MNTHSSQFQLSKNDKNLPSMQSSKNKSIFSTGEDSPGGGGSLLLIFALKLTIFHRKWSKLLIF
jgi:hypothetical protein